MVRGCLSRSDASEAELISLWVAPEARGKAVGEALVAAVQQWAKAAGFERLCLNVYDDNHFARDLYQRCGFEFIDPGSTVMMCALG